jgi:hypothetical protein
MQPKNLINHHNFMTNNFDVSYLRIASPCTMNWEHMSGDERSRFCQSCQLNVYNLSEMSVDEIEKLILQKEGRVCGRLYKRADGTVITKDCPTGLRAIRKRMSRTASAIFASVIGLSAIAFGQVEKEKSSKIVSQGKVTRFESRSFFATINGTVTDSQGAMIPQAIVVCFNNKTKKEYKAVTNDSGDFKLENVPSGSYSARFSAYLFEDYSLKKLKIISKENLVLEISLLIKDGTQVVGLLSIEPQIEVTSSHFATSITSEMINRVPHDD